MKIKKTKQIITLMHIPNSQKRFFLVIPIVRHLHKLYFDFISILAR